MAVAAVLALLLRPLARSAFGEDRGKQRAPGWWAFWLAFYPLIWFSTALSDGLVAAHRGERELSLTEILWDAVVATGALVVPFAALAVIFGPIGYLVYRLVRHVDREDARAAAEREAVRRVGRPDHPAPPGPQGGAA